MRLLTCGNPAIVVSRCLLTAVLVLLVSLQAHASEGAAAARDSGTELSIQVVDASGAAIAGARVEILSDGRLLRSDAASPRGEESLRLPAGTY